MLKELKANASTSFVNFVLAIIASYWVAIFHDIENSDKSIVGSYMNLMINNGLFLFSNGVLFLLIALSLDNIRTVIKINNHYIPRLQKVLASLDQGKSPQEVKDSFADLHEFFTISDVTEGDSLTELIVKPIKLNTYIVSVRNIVFSLRFQNGKYHSYSHEETERT